MTTGFGLRACRAFGDRLHGYAGAWGVGGNAGELSRVAWSAGLPAGPVIVACGRAAHSSTYS